MIPQVACNGIALIDLRMAVFNDSASGDPAVCILAFGGDKTSTAGDFTIQFPAADSSNAIIRIA